MVGKASGCAFNRVKTSCREASKAAKCKKLQVRNGKPKLTQKPKPTTRVHLHFFSFGCEAKNNSRADHCDLKRNTKHKKHHFGLSRFATQQSI